MQNPCGSRSRGEDNSHFKFLKLEVDSLALKTDELQRSVEVKQEKFAEQLAEQLAELGKWKKESGDQFARLDDVVSCCTAMQEQIPEISAKLTAVSENEERIRAQTKILRNELSDLHDELNDSLPHLHASQEPLAEQDKTSADFANSMIELDAWKQTVLSRVQTLEDGISGLPAASLAHTPRSSGNIEVEAERALSTLVRAHKEIEDDFYHFEMSVYDCSVLVFSELVYLEDSLAILFGVFASIAIQLTMLLLISQVQLDDPLEWQDYASVFRLRHAHQWVSVIQPQKVSLARAVCDTYPSLPFKSRQRELIYKIEVYTEPLWQELFPQGLTMIMMILVLWICTVVDEIRDCFKMTMAIWSLPHSCGAKMQIAQIKASGKFKVVSIGNTRMTFLRFICVIRLIVGCSLCVIGCRWLVQTLDIEELLLNAIGLSFIVNIDETMLNLMVSAEVNWMMENMAPLPSPACFANRRRWNHFILSALGIGAGISIWIFFMFVYALPYLDNLHIVHDLFCGGNKDFAVRKNETSGLQLELTNDNFRSIDHGLLSLVNLTVGVNVDPNVDFNVDY